MTEQEKILAVARLNARKAEVVGHDLDQAAARAEGCIASSSELLMRHGRAVELPPSRALAPPSPAIGSDVADAWASTPPLSPSPRPPPLPAVRRGFEDLLAEAQAADLSPVEIDDLLSAEEIVRVHTRLAGMREDFRALHRMDRIDYAIAGCAGLLGAVVDLFLIQMPISAGMLGAKGITGGPLSNWVREQVNNRVPKDRLQWLEGEFKVPYDAPHSADLLRKIDGLSPRTHRFHSLGHDPLLGWLFGVADIMQSKMSAIDKHGNFIRQAIGAGADPSAAGVSLFTAIYQMVGHLLSDVATPAGLPAPLMSLFLLAQGKLDVLGGRSPGEMARAMYGKGYDFRHFLAMGTAPLLIEAIVRIGYFWKATAAGQEWTDALPVQAPGTRQQRLHSMLFTAHAVAASANVGKIALQGGLTPIGLLSLNYPQWLALGRYSVSQAIWIAHAKPKAEIAHVQGILDVEWEGFFAETGRLYREAGRDPFLLGAESWGGAGR